MAALAAKMVDTVAKAGETSGKSRKAVSGGA